MTAPTVFCVCFVERKYRRVVIFVASILILPGAFSEIFRCTREPIMI
jgi:hypothetical protein